MTRKTGPKRKRNENGSHEWLGYRGLIADLLKRKDTHESRHIERGLFTWRWVHDAKATQRMVPVLNPILITKGLKWLQLYQSLVNRTAYRKPHYDIEFQNNGIFGVRVGVDTARYAMGEVSKNYCADCKDYKPVKHTCEPLKVVVVTIPQPADNRGNKPNSHFDTTTTPIKIGPSEHTTPTPNGPRHGVRACEVDLPSAYVCYAKGAGGIRKAEVPRD